MKLIILSVLVALIAFSESASLKKKRDTTVDDLVAKAKALLGEATTTATQLASAGKATEAVAVVSEMDLVQQALKNLTSLDPENALTLPALKVAEDTLETEEQKLMKQLKALQGLTAGF